MGKKKMKGIITDREDRISNLPDSLIHHILSFLLMRDVIRTCVLSKRWRKIWKSVPILRFGKLWLDHPGRNYFINQSLTHYEGQKIKKLQIHLELGTALPRLESWVRFAVDHGVEELDVSSDYYYPFPECLFESLELTVLKWSGLVTKCPDSFRFPYLTELHLTNYVLTDLDASACPLLEVLTVESSLACLNIYAPNPKLRYLKLSESDGIFYVVNSSLTLYAPNLLHIEFKGSFRWFYEFKDISSVKTANLESWDPLSQKRKISWTKLILKMSKCEIARLLVKLLRNLIHVKALKLCQTCIQILAYGETIGLEIPSLSATCLELRTNLSEHVLFGIASLLRASCYIDQLIINMKYSTLPSFQEMFFKEQDIEAVKAWESLEHALSAELALNTILIQNFPGCRRDRLNVESAQYCVDEVKLVEALLKNSKMLNKMNISIMNPPSQPLKLQLLYGLTKKLLVFPRASANAEVYFS